MVTTNSLLFKKAKRDIVKNWKQFLAIIAMGGIAVTLFVGLLSNASSIQGRVDSLYKSGNLADIWVTTSAYDADDMSFLKTTFPDADVEERLYFPTKIEGFNTYSAVSKKLPTVSKPSKVVDSAPSQNEDNFFMVDIALTVETPASSVKLGVGSLASISIDPSITGFALPENILSYLDTQLNEGKTNPFRAKEIIVSSTVTGIMEHPENVTKASYNSSLFLMSESKMKGAFSSLLIESFTPDAISMFQNNIDELLENFSKPNQYVIVTNGNGVNDIEDSIKNHFSAKQANNLLLLTDRETMPFTATMANDVNQARQMTFVFPFVFFFVALLIILTTTSQIIIKERTLIGSLKAIGVKDSSIYGHYIGMTTAVVGIGTLIGEIIGPLLIPFIMGQKYDILYTLPPRGFVFPLLYGLLTAAVFLLCSVLVTFIVCRKTICLKPCESMRPAPPKIKTLIPTGKKSRPGTKALSLKMAFRNIRSNLAKSIMVVIGVGGCTALLVCGFGIEDTINHGIDNDMEMYYNSQLLVAFSSKVKASEVQSAFSSFEGVRSSEGVYRSSSEIYLVEGDSPHSSSYSSILFDENHFTVSFTKDKVALSSKVAREIGAKVGDSIYFESSSSRNQGVIGAIFDGFSVNGVFVHASFFEHPEEIEYSSAFVYLEDGVNSEKIKAKILSSLGSNITEVTTSLERRAMVNDIMSGVLIMTNAVKVFAILLALVVLYNLALLNFRERIRDIATLKVLGFRKKEIASSLLWETMSLTALGVGLGLAIGSPFMHLVLYVNIVSLVDYLYYISPLTYVIAFLLTFVVALVVNFYLARLTGKVKMVESLKSVE